jgi:GAF domain-containing protein
MGSEPLMVTREERLARTFVELADTLVDDFDVVDLLVHLAERSVELLDAAAAGLLLADDKGTLHLMASTSDAMTLVELFQLQNAEGPCLDCVRLGEVVLSDELSQAEPRWPLFVPVAIGAGFQATHAVPLRLRGRVLGALNLFRSRPGGLSSADVVAAQALADVATIALIQHRAAGEARALTDQLHEALNTRVAIEQAKGVVAEQAGIDVDEAFVRLRRHARETRRRLAAVAQDVVDGNLSASSLPRGH